MRLRNLRIAASTLMKFWAETGKQQQDLTHEPHHFLWPISKMHNCITKDVDDVVESLVARYITVTDGLAKAIGSLCPNWVDKKDTLLREPALVGSLLGTIGSGAYNNLGPMTILLKTQIKCFKWLHAPLTAVIVAETKFADWNKAMDVGVESVAFTFLLWNIKHEVIHARETKTKKKKGHAVRERAAPGREDRRHQEEAAG